MADPKHLSKHDRHQHLVYECALALIGALEPEEIGRLSLYTYVDALQRAQELASVALLQVGPSQAQGPGAVRLGESELAEIEARLRHTPPGDAALLRLHADAERLLREVRRLQQEQAHLHPRAEPPDLVAPEER